MKKEELFESFNALPDKLLIESESTTQPSSKKTVWGILVVAMLSLTLTISAAATDFFHLSDQVFTITRWLPFSETGHNGIVEDDNLDASNPIILTLMSTDGLADSPEALANKEWQEYYNQYVSSHSADGKKWDTYAALAPYDYSYQVYNDEMSDKLEEIALKHSLKLMGKTQLIDNSRDHLGEYPVKELLLSTGAIHNQESWCSGRLFADGSIYYEGSFEYPYFGQYYILTISNKGTFKNRNFCFQSLEGFDEFSFTTKDGTLLSAAMNPNTRQALFVLDLPDSFVTLCFFDDTVQSDSFSYTAENLQSLICESFDWVAIQGLAGKSYDELKPAGVTDSSEINGKSDGFVWRNHPLDDLVTVE